MANDRTPPLEKGARVAITHNGKDGPGSLSPAIVLDIYQHAASPEFWFADFRSEHGDERGRLVDYEAVLFPDSISDEDRERWTPTWHRLEGPDGHGTTSEVQVVQVPEQVYDFLTGTGWGQGEFDDDDELRQAHRCLTDGVRYTPEGTLVEVTPTALRVFREYVATLASIGDEQERSAAERFMSDTQAPAGSAGMAGPEAEPQ